MLYAIENEVRLSCCIDGGSQRVSKLTIADPDEKLLWRQRVSPGSVLVDGSHTELEPPARRVQLLQVFPGPVGPHDNRPRGHPLRHEHGAHVMPFLEQVRDMTSVRDLRGRRRPFDHQRFAIVRHGNVVRLVRNTYAIH